MITRYNLISTFVGLLCLVGLVWLLTSPNFSCVRKGEKIVNGKTYDSLIATANRPPIIRIDTIRDTIQGKPIIKYKDRLVPVYKDSLSTVYSDTLKTKSFKVVTTDTLQWNQLKYRRYDWEAYVDTIIKYIEKDKPVLVDRPVPVTKRGFYYGGGMDYFTKGFDLVGEITYISKKDFYFKINAGALSLINSNKMDYYPLLGIKIGKKF